MQKDLHILSVRKTGLPVIGTVGGRVFTVRAVGDDGIYELELPVTAIQFNGCEWELPTNYETSLRAGGEISKIAAVDDENDELEIGVPPFYHTTITVDVVKTQKARKTKRGEPLFRIKARLVEAKNRLRAARLVPIPAPTTTETTAEAIKT